ncbi:hypothetical protein FYK55_24515 [Roseiconus nitratireducens]|uniref:Uncharacterized protein n=1 Tax=Roseiconus nitratireducens TaxID=2605748 RepID=A0A5M6CVN3_9BACT|nr:hypothetical protein [Roseiconus nitratireducens]KAA5539281.1 hypothetical protein FYK55_24515 [Roseiconus nitratireducens]
MLNRPTFRDSKPSRSHLRTLLRQSLMAGVAVGVVSGMGARAFADGDLQLQAPLNAAQQDADNSAGNADRVDSSAEAETLSPPTSASPTASTASVPTLAGPTLAGPAPTPAEAAKTAATGTPELQAVDTEATADDADHDPDVASPSPVESPQPGSKSIRAIPASGPLDVFRQPPRRRGHAPQSDTESNGLQAPISPQADRGQQGVSRLQQPAVSQPGSWQGRTVSEQISQPNPAQPNHPAASMPAGSGIPTMSTDGISTGNWVARDAINRVAPLRDPQPRAAQAQAVPPQTESSALEAAPPETTASAEPEPSPATSDDGGWSARPITDRDLRDEDRQAESEPLQSVRPQADSADRSAPPANQLDTAAPAERAKLAEPATESATDDASNWADEMLESLMQAPSAAGSARRTETPARRAAGSVGDLQPSARVSERSVEVPHRELKSTASPTPSSPTQRSSEQNSTRGDRASADPETSAVAEHPEQRASDASTGSKPRSASTPTRVGDLDSAPSDVPLDYTGRPAVDVVPNRSVASLRRPIERVLGYFYQRPEIATGRSNWGMMHALMVYGVDTQIIVGPNRYSAVAWIAGNNNCRGQRLLTHDADGIQAKSGVGLQGHQGQFLAVLGMCGVPTDYPLHAGDQKYQVQDLIEAEKRACVVDEELTFTLVGLAHYLDTDSSWMADDGTRWDFERLLEEELKQPIVGAACGGTHRLMGYAHALRKRRAEGKPITGQWKRAETYTADFVDYAYSLQNRDGSMSTDWFEGRADNRDVDRKIQTTGHIVEWLLTLTPDEQLQDPRLVRAVSFLVRSMGSDLRHDWSIGPKGHALRTLAMYHQRVYRAGSPWEPDAIAAGRSPGQHR